MFSIKKQSFLFRKRIMRNIPKKSKGWVADSPSGHSQTYATNWPQRFGKGFLPQARELEDSSNLGLKCECLGADLF